MRLLIEVVYMNHIYLLRSQPIPDATDPFRKNWVGYRDRNGRFWSLAARAEWKDLKGFETLWRNVFWAENRRKCMAGEKIGRKSRKSGVTGLPRPNSAVLLTGNRRSKE